MSAGHGLPVACVLAVLCFAQIRAIDRKQEVPHEGPMCDLLWSDPEGMPAAASVLNAINEHC